MTNIPKNSFDPIAFETKHQADFERSQYLDRFSDRDSGVAFTFWREI